MKDYDDLARVLSKAISKKFHLTMTNPALCALMLAAKSDNILSPDSKSLLVGFGKALPLSDNENDKPNNLSSLQRK